MKRRARRGAAIIEFSIVMLVLVPLLLGSIGTGLNMLRTLETVQLARDAGHMYAKGADFSQPGNQTILVTLGSWLGLTTASTSKALVILSKVTYVDQAMCASDGKVDASGAPLGCTNYRQWVFVQRVAIGNTTLRTSNFGSPLRSGPNAVTVDPTTGKIPLDDQVTKSGAVANFTGINPYAIVDGTVSGLPSGQVIYIAEAASVGVTMMPYSPASVMYSFDMF